jgi:hypothetical protein
LGKVREHLDRRGPAPADWPETYAAFFAAHPPHPVSRAAALEGMGVWIKNLREGKQKHDHAEDGMDDEAEREANPRGK